MPHVASRGATQLVAGENAAAVVGRPRADVNHVKLFSPLDPMVARARVGLANLPTVVAMGPFDDLAHTEHLAAAFAVVRRLCGAQLVPFGTGADRASVFSRPDTPDIDTSVYPIEHASAHPWSNVLAAADVVVPSTPSRASGVLLALAGGRAVVAPSNPITVPLIVPRSAGLVYRPGDVSGMARALLRLLTTPGLRHGMAARAREVARRHNEGSQHA